MCTFFHFLCSKKRRGDAYGKRSDSIGSLCFLIVVPLYLSFFNILSNMGVILYIILYFYLLI